jgi:hypothetical protein
MDLTTFQNQVFFCTVRIVVPLSPDEASIGTGFLLQAPVSDTGQLLLLISNKHVFVGTQHVAHLSFHKKDPNATEPQPLLGTVLTTQETLNTQAYTEHPDPVVDLACLNVSTIGREDLGLFYRTLPLEMAATYSEPWLVPNCDVCFVGYPDGRFDQKNHLPIMRRGAIATIPQTDFNDIKQIVIDAHVHKGSSGSPVFAIPPPFSGQSIRFIGVLTQTMIRGEELQSIGAATTLGVHQTIGLGLVLKVDLVRELIAAAIAKIPVLALQTQTVSPAPTT